MTKKNLLCLIVAALLCLGMVACSKETEKEIETEEVVETTEAEVEAEEISPFAEVPEDYSITVPIYELVKLEGLQDYEYSDFVYDENGVLQQKKEEGYLTVTYKYDEAGNIIEETETSHYGYTTYTRTYDDKGNMLTESESSDFSIRDGNFFEYEYKFDDLGRVIETKCENNTDGNYTSIINYTYDENGNVSLEKQTSYYDGELGSIYEVECYYDGNGNRIKEVVTDMEDGDGWTNYMTYETVGEYTVSAATDSSLMPPDKWVSYTEAEAIPTADSVISNIKFDSVKEQDGAILYTYILPSEKDEANKEYYKYQQIIAQHTPHTLSVEDSMVYVTDENGRLTALIKAGQDPALGYFMMVSFAA